MVTATLVGQTWVATVLGSLAVHGHGSEVHFIVNQSLGVVTIGQLDHHHLLIDGVKIIQSSLHHSYSSRFANF